MSLHNCFFYFRKEMPWKNVQNKREKRSDKAGQEVEGSKEVPLKKRRHTSSSGT